LLIKPLKTKNRIKINVTKTMFSLMMAIDRTYSLYKTEITECIDKLLQIDHKRESYYRDISKNLILFVTHFTL
jgi:hypothetical protein